MSRFTYSVTTFFTTLMAGTVSGINLAAIGNYQGEGSWLAVAFFVALAMVLQLPIFVEDSDD